MTTEQQLPGLEFYPSSSEVDEWVDTLWESASHMPCQTEIMARDFNQHHLDVRNSTDPCYVKFSPEKGDVFWGYWQPVNRGPAPLLIHTPGYGAEMTQHPMMVQQGYNVLHICPLGYCTPGGFDGSKKVNDNWPVLPDTVTSKGKHGYIDWLSNCIQAIEWALGQDIVLKDRLSFFGTSQGGGGSLLLASIYKDKGARCVGADVPFLTNFPLNFANDNPWAYSMEINLLKKMDNAEAGWRALGFIDTISHAHRLLQPTLLVSGREDPVCPEASIHSLFDKLPGTRLFCDLQGQEHGYTRPFGDLMLAWFRLYA